MQTHRIPQHVTGYQGKILGNLTAKQFIYIAVGAIIVFLMLTALPFTTITIIVASLVGTLTLIFSLAKIDDRPLDAWLMNFLLSLQTIPQYVWKKEGQVPKILDPNYKPTTSTTGKNKSEQRQKKMDDFLKFWRTEREVELSESERRRLEKINRIQSQLSSRPSPAKRDLPKTIKMPNHGR